jgi:hypothetical protein
VKQPVEADFDIQVRDAEVEITFKPSIPSGCGRIAAVCLRERAFDMLRQAILVIMPRAMSRLWRFELPALLLRRSSRSLHDNLGAR